MYRWSLSRKSAISLKSSSRLLTEVTKAATRPQQSLKNDTITFFGRQVGFHTMLAKPRRSRHYMAMREHSTRPERQPTGTVRGRNAESAPDESKVSDVRV